MLGFVAGPTTKAESGVPPVLDDWLPFLIYALFAAAIPASMIVFSSIVPRRPVSRNRQRMIPFESGVSEGPPTQERRFTVSFYLPAILFIFFDIEIVCLSTLAVQLEVLGWFGVIEFLVFIGILAVAYVYIWGKGALNWH